MLFALAQVSTLSTSLVYVKLTIAATLSLSAIVGATICPNGAQIAPCVCIRNFNQISCSNLTTDINLKHIFERLKQSLDKENVKPVYDELKLTQTLLEEIGSSGDILAGVTFRHISISRNSRLRKIHHQAFQSSFNTTIELAIEENVLLATTEEDTVELFKGINRFGKLNTLHLSENGVCLIPKKAFDQAQPVLRELIMTENLIKRIDDNAFTSLNALELINLDGNQITKLSPRSLEISKSDTQSPLRIFMRNNKLDKNSFPEGIFNRLRGRVFLNLNMNYMTKLPQSVFESFHHRNSVLTLAKNPLLCDCDLYWVIHANALYDQSSPQNSYMLREFQCANGTNIKQLMNNTDCQVDAKHLATKQCLEQATSAEDEDMCFNASDNNKVPLTLMSNMFIILLLRHLQ